MIAIEKELLEVHVTIEKLKIAREGILKSAALLGIIAFVIVLVGVYAQFIELIEFPIFPATIFAGGILLAIAFRPLQQYKKELAVAEEKRKELHAILKKDNLDYKADVSVTQDAEGEFEIKKSIKLFTIK